MTLLEDETSVGMGRGEVEFLFGAELDVDVEGVDYFEPGGVVKDVEGVVFFGDVLKESGEFVLVWGYEGDEVVGEEGEGGGGEGEDAG